MSLNERLVEYVQACFTGLWIQSHEHEDALSEIAQMCRDQQWRLATWDVDQGLTIPGPDANPAEDGGSDPLAAIRAVNGLASEESSAILVMVNFHRFLQSAEIVQALAGQIAAGKANRTFIVVLSPVVSIPTELDKHFVVVEHDLPSREQLEEIARGIRAKPEDGSQVTEVVLRGSERIGEGVCFNTNRQFLAKAIALGFEEVFIFDRETPVLCQDQHRRFVWALLEPGEAIKTSKDAIRIESPGKDAAVTQPKRQRRKTTMAKAPSNSKETSGNGRSRGDTAASTEQETPASALDQAAELQAALRDAVAKTTALIRTLKREKKQVKLVRSTLASLKQIQTIDG